MKDRLSGICHSERSEESPLNSQKNNFCCESYFCESYKHFFDYTMPRFMQIAAAIGPPLAGENPAIHLTE
jgi:hypothetical protein